jgi:hypothetical protein
VAKVLSQRPQLTGNAEWVKAPILESLQRVICRATNRVFVGVPLCSFVFHFSGSMIASEVCADLIFQAGTMTIKL